MVDKPHDVSVNCISSQYSLLYTRLMYSHLWQNLRLVVCCYFLFTLSFGVEIHVRNWNPRKSYRDYYIWRRIKIGLEETGKFLVWVRRHLVLDLQKKNWMILFRSKYFFIQNYRVCWVYVTWILFFILIKFIKLVRDRL